MSSPPKKAKPGKVKRPISDPSKSSENGIRDAKGKFVPGHPGITPGRPPATTEAAYLDVFKSVVTPDELTEILEVLVRKAKKGDLRAAEVLLKRCVPEKAVVEELVRGAIEISEQSRPLDPIELFQARPDLLEKSHRLEEEIANAQMEIQRNGNGRLQ